MPFIPNRAQKRLLKSVMASKRHFKSASTGIYNASVHCLADTALFSENMRCGIIVQDREAAEVIFRDKG